MMYLKTLQYFSIIRPNFQIASMTSEYVQYFATVPPSGQEIWKIYIFAYNVSLTKNHETGL